MFHLKMFYFTILFTYNRLKNALIGSYTKQLIEIYTIYNDGQEQLTLWTKHCY